MTRKKMTSELTGRDLDAAVARAIGLRVIDEKWPCFYGSDDVTYHAVRFPDYPIYSLTKPDYCYVPDHGGIWPPEIDSGKRFCFVAPVPFYCESDTRALVALDEYQKRHADIRFVLSIWRGDVTCQVFSTHSDGLCEFNCMTLAEAICRAIVALNKGGGEKDGSNR
jgi:hypothetical protein